MQSEGCFKDESSDALPIQAPSCGAGEEAMSAEVSTKTEPHFVPPFVGRPCPVCRDPCALSTLIFAALSVFVFPLLSVLPVVVLLLGLTLLVSS